MDHLFKHVLAPFLECADLRLSFEETASIDNPSHNPGIKNEQKFWSYGTWRDLSLNVATKSKLYLTIMLKEIWHMINSKNVREMLIRC